MEVEFEETDGARRPMFVMLPANNNYCSIQQAKQQNQPAIAAVGSIFQQVCMSLEVLQLLLNYYLVDRDLFRGYHHQPFEQPRLNNKYYYYR